MDQDLLVAEDVHLSYSPDMPVVHGASLRIPAGASIGIVGESGSGKSTLARALVGLMHPQKGSVKVMGRDWRAVKWKDIERRSVQMVFQDPYSSLSPLLSAHQTVAEAVRASTGVSRPESFARAEMILAEVGLSPDIFDRNGRQLSGGQCQRVSIARALARQPSVLVADEPTSSLDVFVQSQILSLLQRLRSERKMALVLISHDLSVIASMCDYVLVMYRGRVVEDGPAQEVLMTPMHPYTRTLLDSIPGRWGPNQDHVSGVHATGCSYAPRCASVDLARCAESQPLLLPIVGTERRCACFQTLKESPMNLSQSGASTERDHA